MVDLEYTTSTIFNTNRLVLFTKWDIFKNQKYVMKILSSHSSGCNFLELGIYQADILNLPKKSVLNFLL